MLPDPDPHQNISKPFIVLRITVVILAAFVPVHTTPALEIGPASKELQAESRWL